MENFLKKFFYYFKRILIGGIIIEILGFIWCIHPGLDIINLLSHSLLEWGFIEWILAIYLLILIKSRDKTWIDKVLRRKIGRILILLLISLLFLFPFYRLFFRTNISDFLFLLEELILLALASYWVGSFIKEKHWKKISKTITFCLINFFIIIPLYTTEFLGASLPPICGEAYYSTLAYFSEKMPVSFKGNDFKEWFLKNGFESISCSFRRGHSDSIEIKGKQSRSSILKFGRNMDIWVEFNFDEVKLIDGVKLATPSKRKIQKCEEIFKLKWKAKIPSVKIYISDGSKIECLILGAKIKGKLKKLGFNFPRPYLGERLERVCD